METEPKTHFSVIIKTQIVYNVKEIQMKSKMIKRRFNSKRKFLKISHHEAKFRKKQKQVTNRKKLQLLLRFLKLKV